MALMNALKKLLGLACVLPAVTRGGLTLAAQVPATWDTIPLLFPRHFHVGALLPSGHVLVAGGDDYFGPISENTEIYDPSTSVFSQGPMLTGRRQWAAAVAVPNGVLIAGGMKLNTAQLVGDSGGDAQTVGLMTVARQTLTMEPLLDSSVLVIGAEGPATSSPRRSIGRRRAASNAPVTCW